MMMTTGPRGSADVGQDVGNAREHRDDQGVRDIAGLQEDEHEDGHESGGDHLPADVAADDGLEVQHHPGEPEVVGPRDHQVEPPAQPVPVDQHVQGEKYGAHQIGQDREGLDGGLEGALGSHRHEIAGVHLAQELRQWAGQVVAGQPVRRARSQSGLLLQETRRLLQQ
jgi:hypothetical protein